MELGLVFLGTSAAVPTARRGLPSIAYMYRGGIVLMDAGEGTQERLQRCGLSPLRIEAVLVTHMHGDHVFGLPGLLQSMAMLGRRNLLIIAGPRGLRRFLEEAARATYWLPPYPVWLVEIEPGASLVLPSGVTVESFPVAHRIPALGYRLVEPRRKPKVDLEAARELGVAGPLLGRLQRGETVVLPDGRRVEPQEVLIERPRAVVVYTGDTAPSDSVVDAARGATVLIHDATFTHDMAEEAHEQGHSTALDAAFAAKKAGVGVLVLTHFSARYDDPAVLVDEAKRLFPRVYAAVDCSRLPIRL